MGKEEEEKDAHGGVDKEEENEKGGRRHRINMNFRRMKGQLKAERWRRGEREEREEKNS